VPHDEAPVLPLCFLQSMTACPARTPKDPGAPHIPAIHTSILLKFSAYRTASCRSLYLCAATPSTGCSCYLFSLELQKMPEL